MRSDTDLILIEHMAARMKYGQAYGSAVAPEGRPGVPYRWVGHRLQPEPPAAPPPVRHDELIPFWREFGQLVGSVIRFVGRILRAVRRAIRSEQLFPICAMLVVFGLLALAAIPLRCTSGCEAPSSEARASLGAMKDRARVVYQRTHKVPQSIEDLGLNPTELNGSYYTSANYIVCGGSTVDNWRAICLDVYTAKPTYLMVTANIDNGRASFNR